MNILNKVKERRQLKELRRQENRHLLIHDVTLIAKYGDLALMDCEGLE